MDISDSIRSKNQIEVDVLFHNFLMAMELDVAAVESTSLIKLFTALNPHYVLPSQNHLRTTIKDLAEEKDIIDTFNGNNNDYISVLSFESDTENHLLSLLVNTSTSKHIFIDYKIFQKDINITTNTDSFCDVSVQKVKELYGVDILFLIYDGYLSLNYVSTDADEKIYFKIYCLSTFIKRLRTIVGPMIPNDEDNVQIIDDFHQSIDDLEKTISNPESNLAVAVQNILIFVDMCHLKILPNVCEIVNFFISPIALAANFLDPNLHVMLFKKFDSLMEKIIEFMSFILPKHAFDSYTHYCNKTEGFYELFDAQQTAKQFWQAAGIGNRPGYKSLSDSALKVISLPKFSKKVNMVNFSIKSKNIPADINGTKNHLLSL